MVKKAYENWNQVIEYDGKSLLNIKQNKKSVASRDELPMGPIDYSNALDNQLSAPRLPVPVPSEPSVVDPNMFIGGMLDLFIFYSLFYFLKI